MCLVPHFCFMIPTTSAEFRKTKISTVVYNNKDLMNCTQTERALFRKLFQVLYNFQNEKYVEGVEFEKTSSCTPQECVAGGIAEVLRLVPTPAAACTAHTQSKRLSRTAMLFFHSAQVTELFPTLTRKILTKSFTLYGVCFPIIMQSTTWSYDKHTVVVTCQ